MFVSGVGLLVVPLQMALTPILRLYTGGGTLFGVRVFPDLDMAGTFLGVWLAHTGFGLPLATYLLRNYIGSPPPSVIETAQSARRAPPPSSLLFPPPPHPPPPPPPPPPLHVRGAGAPPRGSPPGGPEPLSPRRK